MRPSIDQMQEAAGKKQSRPSKDDLLYLALNPNFDTMGGIESFVMRRLSGNKTQGFRRILNSCHLVTEFLVIRSDYGVALFRPRCSVSNSCHLVTEFLVIRSDYGVALFRPRCSVSSLVVWLKLLFPKALQRGHSIFAAVFFRFLIQVNRPVQILFHTQALFI